ncbi:MAG: hypothetical protein QNJ70_14010 [Xenococcaceae cyanobacterium MO_207.B15]|nr:hypothetical protein [Xenococcaceae cyanobacterium MO_207.B15]
MLRQAGVARGAGEVRENVSAQAVEARVGVRRKGMSTKRGLRPKALSTNDIRPKSIIVTDKSLEEDILGFGKRNK